MPNLDPMTVCNSCDAAPVVDDIPGGYCARCLEQSERANAPDFYSLPEGWTWVDVTRERIRWHHPPRMFPVAQGPGVTAWGVPLRRD